MKSIWKYEITSECEIQIPKGAVLLDIQEQYGKPFLWALVDPFLEKETRKLRTYGTGHEISDNPRTYVGTFQLSAGLLVFHVFEE